MKQTAIKTTLLASVFAVLMLIAHLTAAAANPAGVGPDAARESIKTFTIANGLEASLFASEPMVRNPTDTDGDGKADKRELLFTGIKGRDHDHAVHAFVFGPDGKLYFNFGNEGRELHYPIHQEVPLHGVIDKVEMKPVVDLDGNEVNN